MFQAIAFDFGNTLCPWGEEQYWQVTHRTVSQICVHAPRYDFDSAVELFVRARREGYAKNLPRMEENDLVEILARTAAKICGRPLSEAELQEVVDAHVRSFVDVCAPPKGLHELLERLSSKYRLAVLSNYPLSECIRLSLRELGIERHFGITVVSGDMGVIKPSRRIFGRLLSDLRLPPEKVLFVGDDWVADVVGACASGMPCVQIADSNGDPKALALDGMFGPYFRKALESPELSCWREARPLAVLGSILELEQWLEGRGA